MLRTMGMKTEFKCRTLKVNVVGFFMSNLPYEKPHRKKVHGLVSWL